MMSSHTMAYPPGGTFFDTLKRSFTDVPVESGKIATSQFLEAAESLTTLFDVLGSTAFKPVKSDMTGNIKVLHAALPIAIKIRDRQLAAPVDSENLQDLVRNELATKKHVATEGLVWLNRALDFTAQALRQNLSNSGEEVSVSFRAAYGNTLSKHHSFLIKPVFSAAMSATPYRKDFYAKLGDDQARVEKELGAWLTSLENIVKTLNDFLATKEAKW
ncbi:putative glycolipid transfer protein HET-C2 [Aureobasidium pullulans]|uniref:Putative glycolipid transfer protein HET-C2 n=1 Tax=Aureobasidium pullulans TaxID=5580 RepID=A0A4S9BB66_AURPU|nr:putative glycolipid transfer protein HET-C2 [Aureobasidium pullulans]